MDIGALQTALGGRLARYLDKKRGSNLLPH
jgi:hypothetical protein